MNRSTVSIAGIFPFNRLNKDPLQLPTRMVLQWNCDGLRAVGQVPRLLWLLEEQRLDYVGLSETRAKPAS
jgi:hypothetical protein